MIVKINGSIVQNESEIAVTISEETEDTPITTEQIEECECEDGTESTQEFLYKTFELIPHSTITNTKTEKFVDMLADTYMELYERFTKWRFSDPDRLFFETVITKGSYRNYVTVNKEMFDSTKDQARLVWKNITTKTMNEDPIRQGLDIKNSVAFDMKLRFNSFLSLRVDRTLKQSPLQELIEVSRLMVDGDKAIIQLGLQSTEEGWETDEEKGKRDFDKHKPKWWLKNKDVTQATQMKLSHDGFDFVLRLLIQSNDERRRRRISKGLLFALKQLNADNELIESKVNYWGMKKWTQNLVSRKMNIPFLRRRSIITPPEIAQLIKLPIKEIQDEYSSIISAIGTVETEMSDSMLQKGMLLGTTKFREKTRNVFVDTDNWEELCLPNIAIGGMGSGKTRGFLSNWVVESVSNGFGAIAIDPAKRQIGDEVEESLPKEQVLRFNLGQMLFSLDWCEAMYDPRMKSRLAGTIISFFENEEETGGQTERFLRASVMGMKTGKLSEIIRIFTNEDYLDEIIESFRDEEDLNRLTLLEFKGYQDGMRRKILSPIYNRLNTIMGDPHLADCMKSNNSLDMVKLMSQKKAIIIDVPSDDLDKIAIDIIVSLITSKIDLAMRLRSKVLGAEFEFPFFVLLDEPHQYLRSSKIWEAAAVESRKWRVGYVWAFHYWEQIPKGLQHAIRNALPHYHLYPSSKGTFKGLEEEIKPFTIEDGLKLQTFHAINIIRSGGQYIKPFIAKMSPPPSQRKVTRSA